MSASRSSPHQLARLIEDMVEAVCPQAVVIVDSESDGVAVSASVASTLGQAVREAALNVTRHADAETVTIEISARLVGDDQRVRVDVRDDGRGFDPNAIAEGRFGIRVSLIERMAGIGGTVDIASRPGSGTLVSLRWNGRGQRGGETISRRRASEALRSVLRVEMFLFLVWLVVGVQVLVGLIAVQSLTDQTPVYVAQALALMATGIALHRAGERRMTSFEAGLVVFCLAVIAHLVHSALPVGAMPELLDLAQLGDHGAADHRAGPRAAGGGLGRVWRSSWCRPSTGRVSHELGPAAVLQVSFGPVLWLGLATLVLRGLRSIGEQLVRVRTRSRENTQAMAEQLLEPGAARGLADPTARTDRAAAAEPGRPDPSTHPAGAGRLPHPGGPAA